MSPSPSVECHRSDRLWRPTTSEALGDPGEFGNLCGGPCMSTGMSTFGRVGRAALAAAVVLGLAACERWEKELASTNAAGTDSGDGSSWNPKLSADGTKLAFESNASNLGPADTN